MREPADNNSTSLNQKHQTDITILDFSKAFDGVPLKAKLDHYGVRGNNLKWISSFLDGRTRKVMVDRSMSNECPVLSGVPQGSVLGLMLFLLYINDITHQLSSRVRLFSDDCLIYREIKSPDDHCILQQDLDKLIEWRHQWQMSFNTAKCYVMRISLATKKNLWQECLMEGNSLELKDDHPYLGVQLSSTLSWECHINLVTAKATRAQGFIRSNLVACDRSAKEKAYFSLVRPLTEYCCVGLSPRQHKLKNKLEKVQCSAACFVANRPHRRRDPDSVTEILNELGLITLVDRRTRAQLTSVYQMTNNLVAIPETYHPALKSTARTRRANLYIRDNIHIEMCHDLCITHKCEFESIFVEAPNDGHSCLIGEVYRVPGVNEQVSIERYETLLQMVSGFNGDVKLASDQNINYLDIEKNSKIRDFLDTFVANGFIPTIMLPTRITHHSSTLIDNIYVKCKQTNKIHSGIITNDIFDYLPIFMLIGKPQPNKQLPLKFKCRSLNEPTLNTIAQYLNDFYWNIMNNIDSDKANELFSKTLTSALDTHAPEKNIKISPTNMLRQNWMSPAFLK